VSWLILRNIYISAILKYLCILLNLLQTVTMGLALAVLLDTGAIKFVSFGGRVKLCWKSCTLDDQSSKHIQESTQEVCPTLFYVFTCFPVVHISTEFWLLVHIVRRMLLLLQFCPSVCPSVCHPGDSCSDGSIYWSMLCTTQYSEVSSFEVKTVQRFTSNERAK